MFFGNAVDIDDVTGRIAITTPSSLCLAMLMVVTKLLSTAMPHYYQSSGGLSFGTGVAISGNRVWTADDNVPTGLTVERFTVLMLRQEHLYIN